ncbi:hypothetical protein [Marinomonas sp. PE14-40]|uniref:hypothetical protein n=1 Tax=Marinomonas sp. PE14-40 TaxID=3060621 RepID=UPI003F662BBF
MSETIDPFTDAAAFEKELNNFWSEQNFSKIVALFNRYQSEIDCFDCRESPQYFFIFGVLPFKWYSMYQLDQDTEMEKEIKTVIVANKDTPNLLACMCNAVNYHFSFLLDLYERYSSEPSRVVEAARCRYADQKQDMEAKIESIANFDALSESIDKDNWPIYERQIAIRRINEDDYLFDFHEIISAKYVSLPKNNGLLEVEFNNGERSAKLSLPMPNNNSICESGLLSLEINGEQNDIEINRHQVTEHLVHSPFGLICQAGGFEISVANLFYYRD